MGGTTWSDITPATGRAWLSCGINSTGTKIIAVGGTSGLGGNVYFSSNSGSTWTNL